jgi:hypothetical protein
MGSFFFPSFLFSGNITKKCACGRTQLHLDVYWSVMVFNVFTVVVVSGIFFFLLPVEIRALLCCALQIVGGVAKTCLLSTALLASSRLD